MNTDKIKTSAAESITMDALAELALKIGKEIWGEEQFFNMMERTEVVATPLQIPDSIINPSFKRTRLKHKKKNESA